MEQLSGNRLSRPWRIHGREVGEWVSIAQGEKRGNPLSHPGHEEFVLAEQFLWHRVVEFQEKLILAGYFL